MSVWLFWFPPTAQSHAVTGKREENPTAVADVETAKALSGQCVNLGSMSGYVKNMGKYITNYGAQIVHGTSVMDPTGHG